MDSGTADSPVTLVIKAPNQKYDDQTISCFLSWTVEKLKSHISIVYPSKPASTDQRLVYSGKLLLDHLQLRDVLRKQDEYHMMHLVCASRSPPTSPTPHRPSPSSAANTSASTSNSEDAGSASAASAANQATPSSSTPGSDDGLRYRGGPPAGGMPWPEGTPVPAQTGLGPTSGPHPMYTPMQNPPANANIQMNAQGGAVLDDDELNRDWLDRLYGVSRAGVLLGIVYFYSSFSRFVLVLGAMLMVYLAGQQQDLGGGERGGAPREEAEQQQDIEEMERLMDDSMEEFDSEEEEEGGAAVAGEGEGGEEQGPAQAAVQQPGFLIATWSFISTFFTSLIPEGRAQPAN
ncbi:hypothetical protein NHX12_001828 [Muraenolepis orangiensis]|uniref:Homocysteine-responsive endoplasmic reticulum-resident ubiquitin-like domain member 2 protein n=1 Tax=Muraenolepis orangiensis TaxID=630683 RepID=A0A9Q0IFC0_9TELE|nr:hypothetical protein NHX12_001828 [Muraenolepis orangiensis]